MFIVNFEIIILPKKLYKISFFKRNAELFIESQEKINKSVNISFDISNINFGEVKSHTYYLLFCVNLHAYKEIAEHSSKMILMSAVYPYISKVIRDFNFAGIVCIRHLFEPDPILFGLKIVLEKMDGISNKVPLINNERYESAYNLELDLSNFIFEYLTVYHETNKNI